MAHSVHITEYSSLRPYMDDQIAADFVELLFRWGDARFTIDGGLREKRTRGRHIHQGQGSHKIQISADNIIRDFDKGLPIGGNMKAPTRRMAIFQTFAHEIQHANQTGLHGSNEGFFKKPGYRRRPCEVDARLFVDENMEVIAGFLGIELPTRRVLPAQAIGNQEGDILSLAEDLMEFESLSVRDLVEELRQENLANPVNVGLLRKMLIARGVEITKQ